MIAIGAMNAVGHQPALVPQAEAGSAIRWSFINPATKTRYRLVASASDSWRLTKSVIISEDQVRIVHLHGRHAASPVPSEMISELVRGHRGAVATGDGQAAFVSAVLLDLDRTLNVLIAAAREADLAHDRGIPGFRPRCQHLRAQRDRLLTTALAGCRAMTDAWLAAGLVTTQPLPDWLAAGIQDAQKVSARP